MKIYDLWFYAAPGTAIYYRVKSKMQYIYHVDALNVVTLDRHYNIQEVSVDCLDGELCIIITIVER